MKNENVVRKNEYDRYLIPMPFSKLLGERKKKYIFSELEKRHPCFSNKFCFDSRFRLGKKGILSDVVVMDKGKYSAYRKKGGIYFEGLRFKRFRKDFFFIMFPFFLLLFAVFVLLFKWNSAALTSSYDSLSELDLDEGKNSAKNDSEIIGSDDFLVTSGGFVEELFECLKEANGKISVLTWKIRDKKEFVSMQVKDMSPDELFKFKGNEHFEISPVSYEGAGNSFFFSCEKGVFERGNERRENDDFSETEYLKEKSELPYQKEIRGLLLKDNCILIEEKYFPYSIRFKLGNLEVFKSLGELLKSRNLAVKELRIQVEDSAFFLADVLFEEMMDFDSGVDLQVLEGAWSIFDVSLKSSSVEPKKIVEEKESRKKVLSEENLTKVGEVRYADGSGIVFYKDRNGKMIKKERGKDDENK